MNNQLYYIIPVVERYKSLSPDTEEAEKLALLIKVNIGNPATLATILDPQHLKTGGIRFQNDNAHKIIAEDDGKDNKTGSPMDTIDNFLDKFGNNLPATGYLAQMKNETTVNVKDKEKRVEKKEEPPKQTKSIIQKSKDISELQKLIKGKHYKEAIQLIEAQNLNNPQKSIYFAHQMRFIKKLIAIEKFKTSNNS